MPILKHRFQGSTRVVEAWYNTDRKTIRVLFPDLTMWRYSNVPRRIWDDFVEAESAGKFLNEILTKRYKNSSA